MATAHAARTTVDVPRLSRRGAVVPGSLNDEARTVDVVWTTGAAVLRGYYDRFWEQLSLDPKAVRLGRLNNGAPVLDAHDDGSCMDVIGVVVPGSAKVNGRQGTATLRFAKAEDDPEADQIYRKIRDGIITNLSVGYVVYTMERQTDGADKIPVFLATDWEPFEISACPMGADDGAEFRAASKSTERTKCVFINRQEKTMADDPEIPQPAPEAAPSAVAARAHSEADAAIAAANKSLRAARAEERAQRDAERTQAAEEALEQERARTSAIRKLARKHKLGEAWAINLIDAGASEMQAQRAALDMLASNDDDGSPRDGGHFSIHAGDDERDKYVRSASAWLIERTGRRRMLELARKKEPDLFRDLELDAGSAHRGLSPLELARDCLERKNVKTRGMDKMRMLGLAFTYRDAGSQTTSDFANILENVLHKMLLGAYATQDTTWQRFCATDDVPDFRVSNRYRTGSLPSLPPILEHGEYRTGQVPDAAKYGVSTARYGEIFSLSREVIINDDMGALANLAMEFGRAAARTIENQVYALLAQNGGLGPTMPDGNTFFHAAHGNIGTGAAISVVSIDADRVLMRAQKDPNNQDFLSLTPKILLVPDALAGTAAVINRSEYDPDTANKLQRRNMVFNLFDDIIGTPRLAATSTRRYMFPDPMIAAAFVVAFLEGYGRGPIMESQQGWRIDGVEWKVTQYAKAQAADTKAAVTNAGA